MPLPTLREVPRSAALSLADLIAGVVEGILAAPVTGIEAERRWKLLLCLHRLLLWAPLAPPGAPRPRGRCARRDQQRDLVLARLARARRGEWAELWADARAQAEVLAERRRTSPPKMTTVGPLGGDRLIDAATERGRSQLVSFTRFQVADCRS